MEDSRQDRNDVISLGRERVTEGRIIGSGTETFVSPDQYTYLFTFSEASPSEAKSSDM
jgi:hypothetical protein